MQKYSGILFIGDPHTTNEVPRRRKEESFLNVSLDKLDQSLKIAEEKNLFPVCLGDIVNKPYEPDIIVPLIDVLKGRKLLMNLGNHDVSVRKIFNLYGDNSEDKLDFNSSNITIPISNRTTVGILQASGCLDITNTVQERQIHLENGTLVRLLMVPYGIAIPEHYPEYQGEHTGDIINIMVTHHDVNFGVGIQYPGCVKIFPIENCDIVVNGHIHDYKPVQEVGGTKWFNPGNILRTSKTNINNVPAVYSISNTDLEIERHTLKHKDIEEIYIKDHIPVDGQLDEEKLQNFSSQFVEKLQDLGDEKTDDGSGVKEMVEEHLYSNTNISEQTRDVIFGLLSRVIMEEGEG